ncbi:helix-turn-helix domain-containing protein [Pseudomonas helleri]|uniref:helix-turn-helix domain-containing protein n=1 Tax=Pseudomonas helleri TaxID=1608996 RepID=UPI0021C6D212|nr:helix-turn-helix transcriptional regulator [Pseudomonas helleri]MCU1758100.1 helix-turn-helix domain-containing protein [Pseudomonas helleri]
MDLQIIKRNGEPEYAVLSWQSYLALLKAAGIDAPVATALIPDTERQPPEPVQALPGLDQLRDLREGKGLALEVLARTVGISPSYLGMIETGERLPDLAIRRSLAWELGVAGWREAS